MCSGRLSINSVLSSFHGGENFFEDESEELMDERTLGVRGESAVLLHVLNTTAVSAGPAVTGGVFREVQCASACSTAPAPRDPALLYCTADGSSCFRSVGSSRLPSLTLWS